MAKVYIYKENEQKPEIVNTNYNVGSKHIVVYTSHFKNLIRLDIHGTKIDSFVVIDVLDNCKKRFSKNTSYTLINLINDIFSTSKIYDYILKYLDAVINKVETFYKEDWDNEWLDTIYNFRTIRDKVSNQISVNCSF